MRSASAAIPALSVLAVLVAGGSASAADTPVALTLKDHHFDPAEVTVPAGTRLKVTVKNLDATAAEFESDDFRAEKIIPGEQEATFYVAPLNPGTYEFHDEYHEDESKSKLIAR